MTILTPIQHINLKHFSEMCGDDAETMHELMKEIKKEIPIEMEKLNRASSEKDWEEVFQIAHKLKMTFSFLGNSELDKLTKVTEFSARYKIDVQEIPALVKQISSHTNLVMQDLLKANDNC